MMNGLKKLVESDYNLRIGNHNVLIGNGFRKFYYFDNMVCNVNDKIKTFKLNACGYEGYPSTTRTLNDYRKYFESLGYKEI